MRDLIFSLGRIVKWVFGFVSGVKLDYLKYMSVLLSGFFFGFRSSLGKINALQSTSVWVCSFVFPSVRSAKHPETKDST